MGKSGRLWPVPEASLHLGLSVSDPGAGAAARRNQGTVSLNSRGIGLGYQHDVFPSGAFGDTYRAALAGGKPGISGGLALALYRGDAKATAWDAGIVFSQHPGFAFGGVLANIGQPVVRGERLPATLIPSVSVHPFGPNLLVSGLARLSADSEVGFGAAARFETSGSTRVGLLLRVDWNDAFRRTGLTFGLAFGGADRVGAAASTMSGSSGLSAADLYAVSTRSATH